MEGMAGANALLVITWNSRRHIERLIASLDEAMQGVSDWRLVVVDNASSDGTPDLVRSADPRATVLQTGANIGYAAAINLGMALTPDVAAWVILNPDVVLQPNSVGLLLEGLAAEAVGITVPRQVAPDGRLLFTLRRAPSVKRVWTEALIGGRRAGRLQTLGEVVTDAAWYSRDTEATWATGSVMAVSRDCRAAVGPWDESFFLYSEETDFCLRARDAGYRVRFLSKAQCTHVVGESHSDPRLWSLMTANRLRLFGKRHGRIETGAFRAGLVVGEALRAMGSRKSRATASLRLLLRADSRRQQVIRELQDASAVPWAGVGAA